MELESIRKKLQLGIWWGFGKLLTRLPLSHKDAAAAASAAVATASQELRAI